MTSRTLVDTAREVLERSVGLRLDPAQRFRLEYWLNRTAAERGLPESHIVDEIAAEGPALQSALDELTVQETSFFRDPAQFDALRNQVLSTLRPPITIWSAGCAWGHEAYSLAMLLDSSGFPEWNVVASDISSRALRQAQSGRYDERQLAGLSELDRGRYLRRAGDQWEVIPELRQKVSIFRHNLIRDPDPPQASGSAVVFCRNVLIYFDRPEVLVALERIATTMNPMGWVFLGYSESLWQVTELFRLVGVGKAYAYRQPEALPPPPEPYVMPAAQRSAQPPSRRAGGAHGTAAAADGHPKDRRPSSAPAARPSPEVPERSEPESGQPAAPSVAALLAEGEADLQAGELASAVNALRKVVYLDPDHAIAHFQLGLAFELLGEAPQSRRAFAAARAALGRSSAAAEAALEGYQINELVRVIDHRLARRRAR